MKSTKGSGRSSIDRVMLNMKDSVFKERLVKKLVDQYIGLYTIEEIIFTNAVK